MLEREEPLPSLTNLPVTVCHSVRREARRPALGLLLEEAGCHVTDVRDCASRFDPEGVVLVRGGVNLYPAFRRQLAGCSPERRPLIALWHHEPLPPPRRSGLRWPLPHPRELGASLDPNARYTFPISNYLGVRALARRHELDLLAVSTRGQQDFLRERGIQSDWIPLGYEPALGRDLGLERDLDVVVLGDLRVRRRQRLLESLRRRGVGVIATGSWAKGAGVWGDERTELLNRAKILLDLHRYPGTLGGLRLLLGMANRALVVSEPIYAPAPFVPGEHYVSARFSELPGVLRNYLDQQEERERIAGEGHRLVTQEVTMRRSVRRLLERLAPLAGDRRSVARHVSHTAS